jgi:hypothetical protein
MRASALHLLLPLVMHTAGFALARPVARWLANSFSLRHGEQAIPPVYGRETLDPRNE